VKKYLWILCLTSFAMSSFAVGTEVPAEQAVTPNQGVTAEKEQQIRQSIGRLFGNKPSLISRSAVPGFYEVFFGAQVVYVTEDTRYIFANGNVYDAEALINLTEVSEYKADRALWPSRKAQLDALGEASMIVFKSPTEKHMVSVFTDIDCGYCRKLHAEMDQYLAKGISIRYLFFPRAGVDSQSYEKAVSVWCADDPKATMTMAKARQRIPKKSCDNPVLKHMQLVKAFGLNGTPAMILPTGKLLAGYVEAPKLAKLLNSAQ